MSVATVRTLIADREQAATDLATGDGTRRRFVLSNAPVVANSQEVRVNGQLYTEVAANPGPTEYTLDDATGLVVFGAAPATGASVTVDYRHTILSDAELSTLLELEAQDDRLAAAAALDIIATSEALVAKRIRILDLQTDGPAVAEALRKHAAELRRQASEGSGDFEGLVDVAEQVFDPFGARERLEAEALRRA